MSNIRFQVRDTTDELEKLDVALIKLGYVKSGEADRAGWYREMKRLAIQKSKERMNMKTSKIMEMEVSEFKKMLSGDNFERALEIFKTSENALERYQDGARLSGESEYLNPNEYIEAVEEQRSYGDL